MIRKKLSLGNTMKSHPNKSFGYVIPDKKLENSELNNIRKFYFFTEISPIFRDMDYNETRRNAENLAFEVGKKLPI